MIFSTNCPTLCLTLDSMVLTPQQLLAHRPLLPPFTFFNLLVELSQVRTSPLTLSSLFSPLILLLGTKSKVLCMLGNAPSLSCISRPLPPLLPWSFTSQSTEQALLKSVTLEMTPMRWKSVFFFLSLVMELLFSFKLLKYS